MNEPDCILRFRAPEETLALRAREVLAPGEIHVWPLMLSGSDSARESFLSLLDDAERTRAGRYYFERDRKGFMFSRGQMRHLLGLYCGVDGASLRFVAGESGKPALAPDQSFAGAISFNFTHSGGRALLAVSSGGELGVDLESHDRKTDVLAIADRYFFTRELETILAAPEDARSAMFFHFWTAKEAVIKAQGTGLGCPLNAFRVELPLGREPTRVESFDRAHLDEGWFLHTLPCESGWSAALVTKQAIVKVRQR